MKPIQQLHKQLDHIAAAQRDRAAAHAARQPRDLFRISTDPSVDGFVTVDPDSAPVVHMHAGQIQAYEHKARFLLILSGARSGKTSYGPWWLLREMQRMGPGAYLAAAPSYKLLDKGVLPELKYAFCSLLNLGTIVGGAMGEFRFSEEGHRRVWPNAPYTDSRVVFGHAENPESLEALTAKGAWLDECAQKRFKQASFEAIRRRLSIAQGPMLMTTTPYVSAHWIKTDVYDRAKRAGTEREMPGDNEFGVVSFESRMNPAFPQQEWDNAQRALPMWKFDLFYRGRFTRPAGAIYDCFDPEYHVMKSFAPPPEWKRYVGIDFGAPNFAAVFLAEEPESIAEDGTVLPSRLFAYKEYRPNQAKTAKEHIESLKDGEMRLPDVTVGGARSEGQWRNEFRAAGYPIQDPWPDMHEVEVGIDRVYAQIKEDRLFICDCCHSLIDEFASYSRPVDEEGNPLEGIEDKDTYHGLDSLRYVVGHLRQEALGVFLRVL